MDSQNNSALNFDRACINCLLPEPYARLNKEQLCRECEEYATMKLGGIEALEMVFKGLRGKYPYDCMVAFSGGRDSSYALHIAKNVLGLRTLAFNHDNEMAHPQAVKNMKSICKKLGVDFVRIKSEHNYCNTIVSDQIRSLAQFGPKVLKTVLCGPCNVGAYLGAKRVAMQHRVPVIILGNSNEEKLPDELRAPVRVPFRRKLLNPQGLSYIRAQVNKFRHRIELSSSLAEIVNLKFSPKNDDPDQQEIDQAKIVPVFNYIKWDRRTLVETIEKELGWKKPEGVKSSWRFDCHLVGFVNYLWVKAYGYPKSFFGHVKMIRSGTMEKQDALEQLYSTNWGEFTPEMEALLRKKLGIEEKYINIIKAY